jgi:predicted outer membrane repeat protein
MWNKVVTLGFSLLMVMAFHGAAASVSAVDPVTHWVAQDGDEVGTGTSCEDPGYVGDTHAVVIEAIEAAATGDTVHICAGTYLFGASGSVDIADDVTIEGDGPSQTILDGDGDWYLMSIGGAEDIVIKDLAVVNGYDDYGAGIYIDGSSFLIDNVRFDGNHAGTDGGGGLYADESNGVVTDSVFHENGSEWGGAIVVDDSDVEIQNSTFTENYTDHESDYAPDYGGAAIYLYGGTLIVEGSLFRDNETDPGSAGAAIHVYAGSLAVDDSDFIGNRAFQGAAIYLFAAAPEDGEGDSVSIIDSSFVGNRTSTVEDGGAIAHERNSRDVTISRNVFTGNSGASFGGAIEAWLVYGALEISNNQFNRNSAVEGGAVWVDVRSGVADIKGNVFKGNRARTGGAIAFECEVTSSRGIATHLTRSNRYSSNSAGAPRNSANVWASRYATPDDCN